MAITVLKDIVAQEDISHSVERITFNLSDRIAYVELDIAGSPHKVVPVSITDLFVKYSSTPTQKNIIRTFFKYVVAEGIAVLESEITDEIFPDPAP